MSNFWIYLIMACNFSDEQDRVTEQTHWRTALFIMSEDSMDDESRDDVYWKYREGSLAR